jgi:hypothetical protein
MSDAIDRERSDLLGFSLAQRLGALLGEAVAIEGVADCGRQCAREERRLKLHAQNSGGQRQSTAF